MCLLSLSKLLCTCCVSSCVVVVFLVCVVPFAYVAMIARQEDEADLPALGEREVGGERQPEAQPRL